MPDAIESLIVVGLSHRTAPIAVRERMLVHADALPVRLAALLASPAVAEAMVVSTCNRTEVYAVGKGSREATLDDARRWLCELPGAPDLAPHLYQRAGKDALTHLFRVASSLDSMVVGEPQILGQVKDALAAAQTANAVGPLLERATSRAFAAAKRVRNETGIARAAVSLSFVAVELARKIFGALEGRRVLLLGAGEMAELAAKHLATQGAAELLIANRSTQRAEELALAIGGTAHTLGDVSLLLERVDIVIASTAATSAVIVASQVEEALKARRWKPLLFVDLGMPRNIEPAVNELQGAYLYDIDDLDRVVDQNKSARAGEAGRAEALVLEEVEELLRGERARGAGPIIAALRLHARELAMGEAQRTLAHAGFSEMQRESVEAMADAIVNKLLHAPTLALKAERENGGGPLADAVAALFKLVEGSPPEAGASSATGAEAGAGPTPAARGRTGT